MSKKEILAYAITHAPPGVKGGPYEAKRGGYGDQSATLKGAAQWRGERDRGPDEEDLELARMMRDEVRWLRPDARVIRIVRKARPSEPMSRMPDPMPVVRAAMRFVEHCTPALEGSAWFVATREFIDAVDAYRKAGGK